MFNQLLFKVNINARIINTDLKETARAEFNLLLTGTALFTTLNIVEGFLLDMLANGDRCCHAL